MLLARLTVRLLPGGAATAAVATRPAVARSAVTEQTQGEPGRVAPRR